jgi:hypothetical protein
MSKKVTIYSILIVITVILLFATWCYGQLDKYVTNPDSPYASTNDVNKKVAEPEEKQNTYIEVVESCNSYYVGECVRMRSGPGVEYPVVGRLRNGLVLRVGDVVTKDGKDWYPVLFTTELLYPERVKGT